MQPSRMTVSEAEASMTGGGPGRCQMAVPIPRAKQARPMAVRRRAMAPGRMAKIVNSAPAMQISSQLKGSNRSQKTPAAMPMAGMTKGSFQTNFGSKGDATI